MRVHQELRMQSVMERYHLSPREREVARAALGGLSNREIGAALCITEQTAKNHLTAIYQRLELPPASHTYRRIAMIRRLLNLED